jgi:carbonic anhydrase/acetyltransferase-like protein (isoleucine patch superfamily)
MDGAVVGEESIIGAGALVTEGAVIPPRSLAVGAPAVVKRSLRPEEIAFLVQSAANYVQDAKDYWAEASNSQR